MNLAFESGPVDVAPMSKRVAIFGDVGGHARPLFDALVRLGMDPDTLTIPFDLTVVQVGDLIHRGPETGGVLNLVAQIIATQPARWVQLVGNHEALYLPGRFASGGTSTCRMLGWTCSTGGGGRGHACCCGSVGS